jgi:hypothetical protein
MCKHPLFGKTLDVSEVEKQAYRGRVCFKKSSNILLDFLSFNEKV